MLNKKIRLVRNILDFAQACVFSCSSCYRCFGAVISVSDVVVAAFDDLVGSTYITQIVCISLRGNRLTIRLMVVLS